MNEFEVNVDVKKKNSKVEFSSICSGACQLAYALRSFVREKSSSRAGYARWTASTRAPLEDNLRRHSRGLVHYAGVNVHKVCATFTRAHMYVVAHVCDMEESLERVVAQSGPRGGRRGRIGASEAEASLLGDYGSLIPIQRSELHAKRKSRPPENRRYHAENVWSRRRSPLLVMSVLRVAPVKVAPLKNVDIKARAPFSIMISWADANVGRPSRLMFHPRVYDVVWLNLSSPFSETRSRCFFISALCWRLVASH